MFKELSDYILNHLGEIETFQSIRLKLSNFLSIGNTAKVFNNYLVNLNTLSYQGFLGFADLSLSGSLDGILSMMGLDIAYNGKKKGSLEYLNM
jgi:hypothetical protein